MPFNGRKKRRKNIYLHNQGRVPTWPLSPDDARLEQETNEAALDRQMYELNFQVDGSAEKASLQGQIDVLNDRIAADSGLHAYAVRQTPGLVRRQALGDGNCLFATMSLNFFSVTGKNLDSFALRKKVAGLLESVPKKNSHAFLCHDAARIIAINGQYEGADELAIMALAIATNLITTVVTESGGGYATYTYTPKESATKLGLPCQSQPLGQVYVSNRSSVPPNHFDPLFLPKNDGGVSAEKEALALVEAEKAAALEEETRQKEALALVEAEKAAALEEETKQKEALALEASAAAMEKEARQKEAALVEAASRARKRKQQEQSAVKRQRKKQEQLANKRLALAVEMAERRRLKAQCLEDKERPAGKAQRAAALVLASTNPTKSMIEDPAMDAFEQDPTAALAHVCLTTGIHVPGLNNLRRLSNGTCPEEGEQVAIDEAEKTLEALAASVSGAASHAADAYVKC